MITTQSSAQTSVETAAAGEASLGQPISVCFMIDRLATGGTELQLLMLLRHLDRAHFRPSLVLIDGHRPTSIGLEPPGIPILRLNIKSLSRPQTLVHLWRVARFFRQQQVDVLQVYFPDSTYLGALAARLTGVKAVLRTRRDLVSWGLNAGSATRRFVEGLYNRLCIDGVIANSEACRQAVQRERRPPQQTIVIPNGVDVSRYRQAEGQAERGSDVVVGTVAMLRPEKNLDVLLEAARRVADRCPQVRFRIAGDGPLRGALGAQIERLQLTQRVQMLGAVSDVPAMLGEVDLGVLPSAYEGSPNAVLEYMAAGKAIVATSVGGTCELIQNGRNGLLVPPGDPAALADAICLLANDLPLRKQLAATAAEDARQYDFPRMVRRYEEIYRDLCRKGPATTG